ncbi:response regulator [Massilia sp.]|uniref:response regulator n=1 Tax=Massilia sp. TaxID=1882437 RepID=UPI00289BFDC9|nr:response regulator [Massilia sp.]
MTVTSPAPLPAPLLARLLRAAILPFILLLAFAALAPSGAHAAALELKRDTASLDAWSALSLLYDTESRLDAPAALAAGELFSAPSLATGVIGMRKEPTWVRIPLRVAPDAPATWVAVIDYPLLDWVDFHLAEAGRPETLHKIADAGRRQQEDGALKGRVPEVVLNLTQGRDYVLLVRIASRGPQMAPIRIMQPVAFHQSALGEQMLQGMMVGLALCLFLYSLAQFVTLRQSLYGKYAMFVGGLGVYAACWFGLTEQFLWRDNDWLSSHVTGIASLIAGAGGYLFVQHVLARPGKDRKFSLLMRTMAALCLIICVLWIFDLVPPAVLVLFVTTAGSMPMMFGLPGAVRLMRAGEAMGFYFLISWALSFTTTVVQILVAAGKLPSNFLTMHAMQFGIAIDMLMFMRILGLRTKDMQTALLRAEAEARMKSEFLANMSHEIRTPMNAILGMSRLALMSDPAPKLRNYLGKILGAGEHLLALINDILDHSRIEAGKLNIEAVPFELDDMLEHLSTLTGVKTDAKGIELIFRVGPGVPQRLIGDPLRIGQVLINLTGNAVKFTERGEIVVSVEARASEAGRVTLAFSVSDTGIGMTPEQVSRLFQAFSQADTSTTRKYGGTGLGLSISRQLVELMHGAISVQSTPNQGSCFTFTVPLGVADGQLAANAVRQAMLADVRALVVDDSASARAALAEMLATLGVQADTVASGEECLKALARAQELDQPYGIVLMDYLMPGMDGVETIRNINKYVRDAAPPAILMVSAVNRDAVLAQEGELPVDAFLHKPIGPALLYHSILQVLHPQLGAVESLGTPLAHRMPIPDLPRLDGARILLAEDNANNREVALDFMAAARMQVDVAFNGVEAVRMAQQGDYDLVLMDIQMPEMDGLTAAREIRNVPRLARLPIVAMTAHAMASDRALSRMAGMVDHVTKPIDPDLLFCTLLKWIDPARLHGRAVPQHLEAPRAAPAVREPVGALPVVAGIDWHLALENVDGQRSRLEKRAGSFVREYGGAPRILREALSGGDHGRLQSLAHNLKSSAAYVGAFELSGAANRLEQDLRAGLYDRVAVQVPSLVTAAEGVLAGLADLAAAALPRALDLQALAPLAAPLVARLEGYLQDDDARAEDALRELAALLAGSAFEDGLAPVRRAVNEIEYEAALAPLATLAAALGLQTAGPDTMKGPA